MKRILGSVDPQAASLTMDWSPLDVDVLWCVHWLSGAFCLLRVLGFASHAPAVLAPLFLSSLPATSWHPPPCTKATCRRGRRPTSASCSALYSIRKARQVPSCFDVICAHLKPFRANYVFHSTKQRFNYVIILQLGRTMSRDLKTVVEEVGVS